MSKTVITIKKIVKRVGIKAASKIFFSINNQIKISGFEELF